MSVSFSLALLVLSLVLLAWLICPSLVRSVRRWIILRNIPGPPRRKSLLGIGGHLAIIHDFNNFPKIYEKWTEKYGKTLRFKGFGNWDDRIYTTDTLAINHILKNEDLYPLSYVSRNAFELVIGTKGLATTEGVEHKRLRRIWARIFTSTTTDASASIGFEEVRKMTKAWEKAFEDARTEESFPGVKLDMISTITKATFNVGCKTFFSIVPFVAVDDEKPNPLFRALQDRYNGVFQAGMKLMIAIANPSYDWLFLPDKAGQARQNINESLRWIIGNRQSGSVSEEKMVLEKNAIDILIESFNGQPDEALAEKDITDNLLTLIYFSTELPANIISFALKFLADNIDIQSRLRNEFQSVFSADSLTSSSDNISSEMKEEICRLPFLDNVTRETLRLVPSVPNGYRESVEDSDIPTMNTIHMRDGSSRRGIRIPKGTTIQIPFHILNVHKEIWGEDALEFRPDRWDNLPDAAKSQRGLYTPLLSFGLGTKSCPGMFYSIMQIKIFLYALVSHFEFLPSGEEVIPVNIASLRPHLKNKISKGPECPLIVKPLIITPYPRSGAEFTQAQM